MPLNIRDPRAAELARELAARRGTTMTEAIISALESSLRRHKSRARLASRYAAIARELAEKGKPGGRGMSREEIDAMWGH